MRVFIRMEQGPGILGRVLGPFAVCGFAPYALILRPAATGLAFAAVEFDGLDADRGLLLVERLRQMPCVMGARLSPAEQTKSPPRGMRADASLRPTGFQITAKTSSSS